MAITERKNFIATLELREPYPEIARLIKNGIFQISADTVGSDTAAANIDSGSLMSFTAV